MSIPALDSTATRSSPRENQLLLSNGNEVVDKTKEKIVKVTGDKVFLNGVVLYVGNEKSKLGPLHCECKLTVIKDGNIPGFVKISQADLLFRVNLNDKKEKGHLQEMNCSLFQGNRAVVYKRFSYYLAVPIDRDSPSLLDRV